ncbi:hypothetical protein [Bradyrhizobium sp. 30]|uniref:hypothetical protein n=1 Tax=Bradyrhizobium sp. 30 TaxID=2782669 RepID=UPI001FFBD003|nr:hypothetical protein [Bradyrhizobium sp. 30]
MMTIPGIGPLAATALLAQLDLPASSKRPAIWQLGVTHLDRSRYRLGAWLDGLQARMHTNKVTVALAAKIARIAWVVMTKPRRKL